MAPLWVLICYSRDSDEHRERVLALRDRLILRAVDCETAPFSKKSLSGGVLPSGRHPKRETDPARIVVVCSQGYQAVIEAAQTAALPWARIRAEMESPADRLTRVLAEAKHEVSGKAPPKGSWLPVVFSPGEARFVPRELRALGPIDLSAPDGFEALCRRLGASSAEPTSPGTSSPALISLAGDVRRPGRVFISHAEEDSDLAQELARGLERAGFGTWYYERDGVAPGPSYLARIAEAIENNDALLLLITHSSLKSHQVEREVDKAHELARPIVPLLRGISDAEYRRQQPAWGMAVGARTSVAIRADGVAGVLPLLVAGLGEVLRKRIQR
jgi:hypothetical protein